MPPCKLVILVPRTVTRQKDDDQVGRRPRTIRVINYAGDAHVRTVATFCPARAWDLVFRSELKFPVRLVFTALSLQRPAGMGLLSGILDSPSRRPSVILPTGWRTAWPPNWLLLPGGNTEGASVCRTWLHRSRSCKVTNQPHRPRAYSQLHSVPGGRRRVCSQVSSRYHQTRGPLQFVPTRCRAVMESAQHWFLPRRLDRETVIGVVERGLRDCSERIL
jgi:hypothetical protein